MKRIVSMIMILSMTLFLFSCSKPDNNDEPKEYEIAMIADSNEIEDNSFTETAWESVAGFAGTNALSSECYIPEGSTKEDYLDAIKKAVDNKAKIVVLAGNSFETAAFSAQALYPDVYFLLIDGFPHDTGEKYGAAANTISIIFAEEQAGYLAGYAAVKDGYEKIGFIGGKALPSVKRYGHGFVQGAASAAQENEQKVELHYEYADTFKPSEVVEKNAGEWYDDGVEVIFACGGAIGTSVINAAESCGGKVIGVDTDQSHLSSAVITSAQKELGTVINDILKDYADGKFVGGTAFNYNAQNGGISLQIENAVFSKFTKKDYEKVYDKLKNNQIELKKDTDVDSVKELTGEWVTIK